MSDTDHPARLGHDSHHDELPAELDVTGLVGPYTFPDIIRRRITGFICAGAAVLFGALWFTRGDGGVLVNRGFGGFAIVAAVLAVFHFAAAFPLKVKEMDALVAATTEVGFPVGHASAQLGWHGLRSRPTWRILLYSADEPPTKRGMVLVDGVDATVQGHYVEDNPEDWSQL